MKLTGKEKVSYGLGAVGKDMVYMLSAMTRLWELLWQKPEPDGENSDHGCLSEHF